VTFSAGALPVATAGAIRPLRIHLTNTTAQLPRSSNDSGNLVKRSLDNTTYIIVALASAARKKKRASSLRRSVSLSLSTSLKLVLGFLAESSSCPVEPSPVAMDLRMGLRGLQRETLDDCRERSFLFKSHRVIRRNLSSKQRYSVPSYQHRVLAVMLHKNKICEAFMRERTDNRILSMTSKIDTGFFIGSRYL
jgi:hypothetical protein